MSNDIELNKIHNNYNTHILNKDLNIMDFSNKHNNEMGEIKHK